MSIYLNDFQMVMKANKHKKNQTLNQETEAKTTPKSDKFGVIRKCPQCSAKINSFRSKCPDCGHYYSNIESNASIHKLFKILDDVESSRKNDEDVNPPKDFGSVMVKSFGMVGVGDKINNRKKEIIKNFPIPTAKDDILEFLSLAIVNARDQGSFFFGGFNSPTNERNKLHNDLVPIWKAKCEQIILKARFSMKEDKNILGVINNYARELGIK